MHRNFPLPVHQLVGICFLGRSSDFSVLVITDLRTEQPENQGCFGDCSGSSNGRCERQSAQGRRCPIRQGTRGTFSQSDSGPSGRSHSHLDNHQTSPNTTPPRSQPSHVPPRISQLLLHWMHHAAIVIPMVFCYPKTALKSPKMTSPDYE
jgi:hypothetical protein